MQKADEPRTSCHLDIDVQFQSAPDTQAIGGPEAEADPDPTVANKNLIRGVSSQGNDEARYDTPLALDQEGTEFETKNLVAKGRIGRRVWYRVKWKGYPESENSWVKKKDVGMGVIADYEARHPLGQGEYKFERLVSKRELDGITVYEAKWEGQVHTENVWVGKGDVSAKVVATFEAELS
ncbi:hypothetical protein FOZG_17913 [Fusarium oxysporum Fo47]|uniref:Chromo domain-containing protein n=1 Tax=Fusarium oxysporum Fo47 TaxID=660027 RepID=W9JG41_FUSOX|nr:hypothetical protein FOZG_17913 [Fusarium oxysporum Fo47]